VQKILTAQQTREADRYTIEYEPISSPDLMERAGRSCAEKLKELFSPTQTLKLFCGIGNNGGDGLVIARYVANYFKKVSVYIVYFSDTTSADFDLNLKRLKNTTHCRILHIHTAHEFPEIKPTDILVDAIFGSGLNKPVQGFSAQIIQKMNMSKVPIIAIDMPSGLFAEDNTENQGAIIQASDTLTIGSMKLTLLYDHYYRYTGNWHFIDIQLHRKFLEETETQNYLIEAQGIQKILRPRRKTDHKGEFGHALLVVGSYGKIGAAILSALACLRTGAGLLTIHLPKCGYQVLQYAVPEAMVTSDSAERLISDFDLRYELYSAVGIGPGLGTDVLTEKALEGILNRNKRPLVLDADALNIIAKSKKNLWEHIPRGSILTPHPKEFERLVRETLTGYERHQKQRELAMKYKICIILKGAHTCVALPNGDCYFNTSGNPGMATAGSGDVLTGMLTALLAQGYTSEETALLGVYLHGLAGNVASENDAQESMIARDIIQNIGKALTKLR